MQHSFYAAVSQVCISNYTLFYIRKHKTEQQGAALSTGDIH